MPKCPKCGKEIDFLKNYVYKCTNEYIFDGDRYEFVGVIEGDYEEYRCPECGYRIAETEIDAIRFLRGEQ